ncbi:MAG: bifunctional glycosyltransferase/class I SAM-dependent methyltransferase [Candidatus Sericytochromatia bacterium]|nr:bifunctional glycosyltransferase/class I SAM-dependent methyltransferase [Candidatus Sericytochromatia bacterium]
MSKRIAIFVIAYDAVNTLARTIDRVPAEVLERVEEIFVIDDCSKDNTYYAALGYKQARSLEKLQVFRNPVNLRYGGNQKAGYRYAISRGFDIVVMLHADGQYAPEVLASLLEPLERDEADMVFGSRMAAGGDPLRGGMPLYKFVGNKVLTWIENGVAGMHLSEFHSGYRLYSCAALARLPFEANSDEWHFDTQILLQFKEAGLRIAERPIPTYYGDEICHVNGIAYALNCIRSVLAYRLHRWNWLSLPEYEVLPGRLYRLKPDPHSSHMVMLEVLRTEGSRDVLEVGTADGFLTEQVKAQGARVTGIEVSPELAQAAAVHCERMLLGDVESLDLTGLGPFDAVVCGDVLEHLRRPDLALQRLVERARPGGLVLVCVPNIAMWVWRLKLLFGQFDYAPRGPMDTTHLRFFTLKTALRLVKQAGLEVESVTPTPLPLPTLSPSFGPGRRLAWLHTLNAMVTRLWPTLLGYQLAITARKPREPAVRPLPPSAVADGRAEATC